MIWILRQLVACALGVSLGWTTTASAAEIDYARHVKPVLQARCYACHGALKQESGLRLDTVEFARRGGDSGAAIEPGDAAASLLVERISADDASLRMPPEGEPLSAAQIDVIRDWIAAGAPAPSDEKPERDPSDHWAFKPPVPPALPTAINADWVRTPIDAFISAEHVSRGLTPQPPADKRLWLRRVTLDLIGLPPTADEQGAFLADDSADAYEKVVERLLASPHYGERWGRHWMDIWRYSDWWGLGAEVRNSQKHIWHWRDWIIESLNADLGYDEMLRQMLAADELYPNDLERLRAGGFLARQYFKFNRTSWLDETIEHTSKAMLGLTFNCAKCHDHKYDPISHEDYYRLRAVFEPHQIRTEQVAGELDFERDGIPRAFDCNLEAVTHIHVRGDDRTPDTSRAIEPGIPSFLPQADWHIEAVSLPAESYAPGLRPYILEGQLQAADKKIAEARASIELVRAELNKSEEAARLATTSGMEPSAEVLQGVAHAQWAMAAAEKSRTATEAVIPSLQARAAADRARFAEPPAENAAALARAAVAAERALAIATAAEAVAKAELAHAQAAEDKKAAEEKLNAARQAFENAQKLAAESSEEYTPLPGALKTLESNLEDEQSRQKPFPRTSTGRRTALARWLTDPANPLPARVAMNHLWSRHLGRPLVATVFDFGRNGAAPSHPELLDWLAVEFIEHGWSMKHMHRMIVLSNTYRMNSSAAGATEENLARDEENKFYWRANPVRMEAQSVRDSLLHLAGELDQTLGGPSIPTQDETSRRRSIYFIQSHNDHQTFLETFDDAMVRECYRRSESIVPQQALALANSPLAAGMAGKIAARLNAASPEQSDEDFARAAFVLILAEEPTADELSVCREALAALVSAATAQNHSNPSVQARTNLVHALLNHNDFVTVR
ncbi:MAG: PSD1 domain-containing protein [Pirellulales bacterium]|nr:PSD1 domain-containing protein [Pirellulales bacterium]